MKYLLFLFPALLLGCLTEPPRVHNLDCGTLDLAQDSTDAHRDTLTHCQEK